MQKSLLDSMTEECSKHYNTAGQRNAANTDKKQDWRKKLVLLHSRIGEYSKHCKQAGIRDASSIEEQKNGRMQ